MSIDGGGPVPSHYGYGNGSYRRRAFKLFGAQCAQCAYSKDSRMLDVHHVDGNRKNSSRENLIVLCVWCHVAVTRKVTDPGVPGCSSIGV